MILRKTDTSKTVTTANTWQTSIDLSTISDFSRFFQTPSDPYPIRLFDGTNKIAKCRLVPFGQRLEYKESPNTAVYDYANKLLYLRECSSRRHALHSLSAHNVELPDGL